MSWSVEVDEHHHELGVKIWSWEIEVAANADRFEQTFDTRRQCQPLIKVAGSSSLAHSWMRLLGMSPPNAQQAKALRSSGMVT
jgi:hypothetical protein